MRILALCIVSLAALGACSKAPTPAPLSNSEIRAIQIENGREVARAYCGACHALDGTTASPRADAPPLSVVLAGYDGDELLVDFVNGAHVGSPDMPVFNLNPAAAADLLVYLRSIEKPSK